MHLCICLQMDKASIVGDAVLYVQQLQMKAKKLKSEIAGLESSMVLRADRCNGFVEIPKKSQVPRCHQPMFGMISQVGLLSEAIQKTLLTYGILIKFSWIWICRWMCFK